MKAIMQGAAGKPAVWVSLWCAVALFACTAEQEVKCGEGTELVGGRCIPLGDSGTPGDGDGDGDGDVTGTCGPNTFLRGGACEGKRPIGSACETGEQCLSETCLGEDKGATDGYCTQVACGENRPCEAGSQCYYSRTEGQFLCLVFCDDANDCRDGYACQPLYTTDVSVCAPSCTITEACPAGTLCNAESGACELHECELGASDPCAVDEDAGVVAGTDLVCYADRLGISETGAVCLPSCDPSALQTACAGNEVCQPLPEDPANSGLCVPPLCSAKTDCSAGAVCMNGVCQPPARCDESGECANEDLFVCVGGAGGQCMPRCPENGDEGCAAMHPGLSCSPTLDACLPTGAFPGSVCRSELSSPCDPLTVRVDDEAVSTPLVCENGVCLASCGSGGDELCGAISSTLTCATDVFDEPLCLPKGSFPGGPCDSEDACGDLDISGDPVTMSCARGQCIANCDDGAGGDLLCDAIDASLVCIADAFNTSQDMCVPRGAYPGGPCGPGDACTTGMTCEDNRCLYQCGTGGEGLCNEMSDGLSCAYGVYDEPVCLPFGTFPGSPCRPGADQCDQNLSGLADADMVCANNKCVVQCEAPGAFDSGDALCGVVSSALTCLNTSPIDLCVTACGESNACPPGNSCLVSQDACLPTGSFLGSPCAGGTTCDGAATPPLACAPSTMTCAAACSSLSTAGGSTYCQGVASNFGQSWDTCIDADAGGPGTALICVDGTP